MKFNTLIVFIGTFLFHMGCAQIQKEQETLTKRNSSKPHKFWAHHYNTIVDLPYGDDPDQRLDIYTYGSYVGEPNWFERSRDKKPTFVWFHGGGWRFGRKETDAWFFTHFLEKGWNVVNVEYRKGLGTAPDAAEDALLAMKWIQENAEEYRLDINNIVISGASAGGHLALLTGLINSIPDSHPSYVGDEMRVKAIINWYGHPDLEKIEAYLSSNMPETNFVLNWVGEKNKLAEISKKYSPIHYVTESSPAVLSIQGEFDSINPYSQSLLLHEKLDRLRVKNQLLTLKGGTHLGFTEEQFQLIFKTIFEFLEASP